MSIFDELAKPFAPDLVSWRCGATNQEKTKAMALAYIDARDVMNRLDEVVGPENWQCDYPHANGKTVCRIGLKADGEWVWKADGAGDTDHEAEKGALSDAFKRAAVRWGVGRYLYDLGSPWVEIEQKGRSYVIKKHEQDRLAGLLPNAGPVITRSHRLVAFALKAAINMAQAVDALNEWGADEKTKKAIGMLPEELQHETRMAFAEKLHALGYVKARAA